MSVRSVAAASTVVVPAVVVAAVFLAAATSHPGAGAGIAANQRPLTLMVIAAGGLGCWVLASSAIFALFVDPKRLPGYLQGCAWVVIAAPRPIVAGNRNRPSDTSANGYWEIVPTWQLLVIGLVLLPLLMWVAPMCLGWLVVPDVYDGVEAAGVVIVGAVVIGWTAWLVQQAGGSGWAKSGRAGR